MEERSGKVEGMSLRNKVDLQAKLSQLGVAAPSVFSPSAMGERKIQLVQKTQPTPGREFSVAALNGPQRSHGDLSAMLANLSSDAPPAKPYVFRARSVPEGGRGMIIKNPLQPSKSAS